MPHGNTFWLAKEKAVAEQRMWPCPGRRNRRQLVPLLARQKSVSGESRVVSWLHDQIESFPPALLSWKSWHWKYQLLRSTNCISGAALELKNRWWYNFLLKHVITSFSAWTFRNLRHPTFTDNDKWSEHVWTRVKLGQKPDQLWVFQMLKSGCFIYDHWVAKFHTYLKKSWMV